MITLEELNKHFEYEFKYWVPIFGSKPIKYIKHYDFSENYDIDIIHIFKLQNGKIAFVREVGHFGYSPEDAQIELLYCEQKALEKFYKIKKNNID